jgi:tripartite-type tricarboxylate transporter receptor subunit TctC
MPADIVEKLNAATRRALGNAELKARLFKQGSDATGSSPQEFLDQAKAEHAKWGKVMSTVPKI